MDKKLTKDELVSLVLSSFSAERQHDIAGNDLLLHPEFAVTDMVYRDDGRHMHRISGTELSELISKAFPIAGREFEFPNVIADEESQTVMVEFVESYPDPQTGKVYRTPQIAVCVIRDGKIYRTRHYMDPRLSYEYLDKAQINQALS